MRVAFIVQRYGVEVNGGAEALCRMVAERMARHWQIEVITTCALDYMTWADHYQPGVSQLNGVTVRRFPVEQERDIAAFNQLSASLLGNADANIETQEEWMRAQGPWSPSLLEYLASNVNEYEICFFFGYLYAPTYFGLPLAAGKAVLVPFAHDEWMIHLGMWERRFAQARLIVFSTPEERAFLARRFPLLPLEGPVVGVAVERPDGIDPQRFRREHGLEHDFILYVGRVDESKGCRTLFDSFQHYVARTGDPVRLVTLGRAVMDIPQHPQIVPLGFLPEQAKWDALAACDLLIMPSPYESLSIVLLEAWAVAKPVLINDRSEVLRGQVRRANGGLAFASYPEFESALTLLRTTGAAHVFGRQGWEFVNRNYRWDLVEQAYCGLASFALS